MTMLWLNMEESTGEAGIVVFTIARIALCGKKTRSMVLGKSWR